MNNNAFERPPFLEEWLKFFVGEDADILEPGGWFIHINDLEKYPGAK